MRKKILLTGALFLALLMGNYVNLEARDFPENPKATTKFTPQHSNKQRAQINRQSPQAEKGLTIPRKNDQPKSWNMMKYAFLRNRAPLMFNPKLREQDKIIFIDNYANHYGGVYNFFDSENNTITTHNGFMDAVINENFVMSRRNYPMYEMFGVIGSVYGRGIFFPWDNDTEYFTEQDWYDSNTISLDSSLSTDSAQKYVDYMNGAEIILRNAHEDFAKGEYLWVVEVTKQVIIADPSNEEARLLCADALEQLGYDSEFTQWRDEYLSTAYELRNGVRIPTQAEIMTDVLDSFSVQQLISMIAVRVNVNRATAENIIFNIVMSDDELKAAVHLRNGVLVYLGKTSPEAKFTVTMPRHSLYILATGAKEKLQYTINNETDKATFENILTMLDPATGKDFKIVP